MAKTAAKTAEKKAAKPDLKAFQEEVRQKAEEAYKKRTAANKPGDSTSDWLEAEKQVKKKYGM